MDVTKSTFFNNISNLYWKPISFSMLTDQISIKETPVLFNNGMYFNINELLNGCVDFKLNNKTGMVLTGLKKTETFLQDKKDQNDSSELKVLNSPLGTINNDSTITVLKITSVNTNLYTNLITSSNTTFNDQDVFRFTFYPENYVMINDINDNYLTCKTGEGINNLTLEPKLFPINEMQKFDYFLGENTISLFQINDENNVDRFSTVITTSPLTKGICYAHTLNRTELLSSDMFPEKYTFNLMCYNGNLTTSKNNVKNSFLVKYDISKLDFNNELKIDETVKNEEYNQNYIALFPNENCITDDGDMAKYPLVLHGLKNYQTPEYKYSFGVETIENEPGVRRLYDKIHSGTNQSGGYKNLFLGFNSKTLEFKFKSGVTTEFYFPPTSERLHIKDSGLIEDGAIPGEIPYVSDKIFIKQQSYAELTPDKPQPKTIFKESNTWACSWLSGSIDGNKVWMDRYYNPAYYTLDQALSTKSMVYNDRLYPTEDYTFDIPSTMYFEPGILYKYSRLSQDDRKTFLNYFSSNSILQITNWESNNLKYDYQDGYGIVYYNKPENLKIDFINLDGTNHILFPATTKLLEQFTLTVSMWLYVNDWNSIEGSQIFGNYYNSGYGLINESSITTPIMSIIDSTQNKIFNLNYKFSLLNVLSANNLYDKNRLTYNTPKNEYIQRLPDFNYWIFDKTNITGIKFDIDNQSIVKVNFDESLLSLNVRSLTEISQVEIDQNENIYLYDNTIKKCISFSTYGVYLSSFDFDDSVNRIEIDLNGNLLPLYSLHSVIDNDNNVWEILGSNLYKNKKIFANIGLVEHINCDADNNIWILHNQDSITKIDQTINKIAPGFPKRISKSSYIAEDPCYDYTKRRRFLDFIRTPKDNNSLSCDNDNKTTEDRLVLVDKIDNQLYILDQTGNILMKLNLFTLIQTKEYNILANGDFTGYNFLRKFLSINKKISWKLKIAEPNGNNGKLLSLPVDISNVPKGWHNFTLVFNSNTGQVTSYIDTLSTATETFEPKRYQIYYNYRTSLLLGAETIKNTILNDIIDINDGYKFVGKISELRLYNKPLTYGELEQIYYSSPLATRDSDLMWNMNVGSRNYIEEIAHWFRMQLPGSKSKFFNINIYNFKGNDDIKLVIEDSIRENIYKISPAHTELYKINWI